MAYFVISDFSSGLDVRKSPFTSVNGSLQKLDDGHITRGGEIEKRKALQIEGDFPDDTIALVSAKIGGASASLVVFGDDAVAPAGMPAGVKYQQLAHPDGATALIGIADLTLFDGKIFVAADFADGSQWVFYDGQLVDDWGAGVVRADMATNDDIAEHLRSIIDADADYSATRAGNTLEITGPLGTDFPVVAETQNVTGGVDDQSMAYTELVAPIVAVAASQSAAEFAILMGSVGAGNMVDAVRVDNGGVFTDLLSSSVPFNTSPELTAFDVATNINAGIGSHGYDALSKYGKVFIYAPRADGESADGRIIEVTAKGNVILYGGSFTIAAGTASAGVNKVTSVKANGLEILGASVDWATSNATTAAAVAAQICAYASSPKYNAYSEGESVFVSPERIRSDDPTSITLSATSGGDVTFEPGTAPQVEDQYPDYEETSPATCVAVESYLPMGGVAGDISVGDTMALADPVTLEAHTGVVNRSDRGMQRCFRIVTSGGASLVCSDTAPIPVRAGGYRRPMQLAGHEIAVRRKGGISWEKVEHMPDALGFRAVQNITVENACFWAGEQDGIYILHHNLKIDDSRLEP